MRLAGDAARVDDLLPCLFLMVIEGIIELTHRTGGMRALVGYIPKHLLTLKTGGS